jgi:hypothetical protein
MRKNIKKNNDKIFIITTLIAVILVITLLGTVLKTRIKDTFDRIGNDGPIIRLEDRIAENTK